MSVTGDIQAGGSGGDTRVGRATVLTGVGHQRVLNID